MAGEVMRRSSVEEVVGGFCGSSVLAGPGLGSDSELHVLAVDDSLVDRKVIERLLRISSCRVTTVDSGMRALQFLGLDGEDSTDGVNDLKINLIMTDYSMPGMTGYELLKKIKGSMTFREVPVVIMSSENVLTRVDRCLEEGAEDFLMKPVKLSDVKRLKEFVMRGEIEETGNRRVVKRKLQDDIVPSSSPSDFSSLQIPAFEAAMSKIPSLTPPSSILPKKPKLQRGESPSPFI